MNDVLAALDIAKLKPPVICVTSDSDDPDDQDKDKMDKPHEDLLRRPACGDKAPYGTLRTCRVVCRSLALLEFLLRSRAIGGDDAFLSTGAGEGHDRW